MPTAPRVSARARKWDQADRLCGGAFLPEAAAGLAASARCCQVLRALERRFTLASGFERKPHARPAAAARARRFGDVSRESLQRGRASLAANRIPLPCRWRSTVSELPREVCVYVRRRAGRHRNGRMRAGVRGDWRVLGGSRPCRSGCRAASPDAMIEIRSGCNCPALLEAGFLLAKTLL